MSRLSLGISSARERNEDGFKPEEGKGKLAANAMKRVAADGYLPTPWPFESAERSDDRADYCLDCSFLPQWKDHVIVFTLVWSGARPMGEQWRGLGPMSISSELGHIAVPI